MEGKEVDWIYGDYLMSNDVISLIIAAPIETRDANLTVREIGASILDLTTNEPVGDQLSAFVPAAGRYQFFDASKVQTGMEGETAYWQCSSSKSLTNDETVATVRYELMPDASFVRATVMIRGEKAGDVQPFDGIRADRTFQFDVLTDSPVQAAFCRDAFFQAAIGFVCPGTDTAPQWGGNRMKELRYRNEQVTRTDDSMKWTVDLYPASSELDLRGAVGADDSLSLVSFSVDTDAPKITGAAFVKRATLSITGEVNGIAVNDSLQINDLGRAHVRLPAGEYHYKVALPGYQDCEGRFEASGGQPKSVRCSLTDFTGFTATVIDGKGSPIATKATIYAADGNHPDFGPDSTRTFIKNCVYAVHGQLVCPLAPGEYTVWFSHGPEYNAVSKTFTVDAEPTQLEVELARVVDTTGWVSTELHSHSSPSGDNTSDQFGRVENLLCEHLEYAPCTEHARIDSYVPHLRKMNCTERMATDSGMELTGRPLPANHQNAFPLHHHPHTQNGGGPTTDANPVVQIERLAMWDNGADKIVQMNHPNLHQLYGDLDVDGTPDEGFRGMFQFMDVIEVHPLETIFEDVASAPPNIREMRIPLFQWMQLLNQGYRIPGVVNTDAHYNHHGSGWLRNWFACSTDDPAGISTEEMILQAESGHIIMSSGPFLRVQGVSASVDRIAMPGDDLLAKDGKVKLQVSVQCPNWLDVNRVQVFINGRGSETHNRTRKSHSEQFGDVDAVTKFEGTFEIDLTEDAHLIVATVGEGMTMDKVMGEKYGQRPPIAVSNPIFVDLEGDGFDHNHDELGLPLPKTTQEHSHE